MRTFGVIAALFLLAACGEAEDRQETLTADEEQQLNDAAAMLDEPEGEGAQGKTREPADE